MLRPIKCKCGVYTNNGIICVTCATEERNDLLWELDNIAEESEDALDDAISLDDLIDETEDSDLR